MFKGLKFAVAAAALTAMSPAAVAQNVEASYQQVADALQSSGYKAQIKGSGDKRMILSATSGYDFGIFFFGCDNSGNNCKTVQFYAAFVPSKKPTLEQMNEYASVNRWGRIFLDNENDPVITMDIDLEDGGMSPELFQDNIEYWEAVMNTFAGWVFENANE